MPDSDKSKCKQKYQLTNLVSNQPKIAQYQDINLVNPWGLICDNSDNSIWVANNASSTITHYNRHGKNIPPATITFASTSDTPVAIKPTGIIINKTQGFVVAKPPLIGPIFRAGSYLLIATQNGIIYGYNPLVDTNIAYPCLDFTLETASFTGLAQFNTFLYVADFLNNTIRSFSVVFGEIQIPTLQFPEIAFIDGDISDPIPSNYSPYNIAVIHNRVYVAYAQQSSADKSKDQPGLGNGFISVFNIDGRFVKRLVSRGHLNSPWGMVVAPKHFGIFKDQLLVGNHGDGIINVYNFDGKHLGTLRDKKGHKIRLDGLWGLDFLGRIEEEIFTTAGPIMGTNGLLSKITSNDKKNKCGNTDSDSDSDSDNEEKKARNIYTHKTLYNYADKPEKNIKLNNKGKEKEKSLTKTNDKNKQKINADVISKKM